MKMGEDSFLSNGLYIFIAISILVVAVIPVSRTYDTYVRLPRCERACEDANMTYEKYVQVALGPGRCWCAGEVGMPVEIPFE